ncbi:hypothetical protein NLX86_18760 [Streptomyces sp. A3M-1-3]|uniref:hypothetical protein n=1 Tax=Streptomyces sp. A3M-1-3 TaxID=2962044 RepID=UPI0020B68DB5|nr:hypothetical protein [Streptomyces sp. A3M-1-3]MCP3820059.1 hypothetical protein [Streptomyces sp. A3M-1-3]
MAIPGNMLSATTESVDPNTSGWVSKLNCTISKGTGGRNGDGLLKLTSVASGEMQARTVSSYTVTQWQEYQTFADASGATVPERIGIRWLNSANAEISISWSLTTATASATLHRISVADWAPAGAVKAQVVVSSTPAAAGVISNFENVYLGVPQRTTGNLLAANTENQERAAFWEWTNENNCTIARAVPMFQWPVDYYLAGGHMLAMTVTANGDAWTRSTDWPEATPGVEYMGYCYLNPPTSGSTVWVELRFHDAGGAQLAATRSILAAPGTGVYRQVVSAVAPAGTATTTLAAGITGGTAGQVLRIDGAVITVAPVLRAGSVVPYADASFEQGIAGWTVVSGVATLARSSPWGAYAVERHYALTITSATATTSVIRSAKFPVGAAAAGKTFRSELSANQTAGGWTLTRAIRWYDAANTDLGTTASSAAAVPTPNWWILSNDFVAPAGATQGAFEWTLTATAASSVLRVDRPALFESLPLTQVVAHNDTANITVTYRELDLGELLTVWRVAPDGTRTLVRGTSGLISGQVITSDLMVIEDYEAPLGVVVSYYMESVVVGSQTPEFRATNTVTIASGDSNYCWLKDPGRPQRNMRVQAVVAPDWRRPVQQAEHQVRGRRNAVVLSDVRGGLAGDLTVRTQDDNERVLLHSLLDSGSVLLVQFVPGLGLEDRYAAVGETVEARITAYGLEPRRLWTLPLRQSDMPSTVGVAGSAGRTWQDISAENTTWNDLLAKYATWEGVFLDKRIGG